MRLIKIDPEHINSSLIAEAARILREGELVAFPTETVYGLAAHALNEEAVAKIYAVKKRSRNKPLAVCVTGWKAAESLVEGSITSAKDMMKRFWPGPLTLVMKGKSIIPDIVTAGTRTIALRCPSNPIAIALLKETKVPLVVTSANISGAASATTAQQVAGDLGDNVDLILDGGPTQLKVESTVLDLTVTPPALLREGAISRKELSQFFTSKET